MLYLRQICFLGLLTMVSGFWHADIQMVVIFYKKEDCSMKNFQICALLVASMLSLGADCYAGKKKSDKGRADKGGAVVGIAPRKPGLMQKVKGSPVVRGLGGKVMQLKKFKLETLKSQLQDSGKFVQTINAKIEELGLTPDMFNKLRQTPNLKPWERAMINRWENKVIKMMWFLNMLESGKFDEECGLGMYGQDPIATVQYGRGPQGQIRPDAQVVASDE